MPRPTYVSTTAFRQPLRWTSIAVIALALTILGGPAAAAEEEAPGDDEARAEEIVEEVAAEGEAAAEEDDGPELHVGGALRFNYYVKSWDGQEANRDKGGDFDFDTFRINVDGSWSTLRVSTEYRFYAGYSMLHHGYLGWEPTDWLDLQAGVHQVPFGIQTYASHNWFFDIGYYLGFEDDYDLGLKAIAETGGWTFKLAFYKNDEGSYTGGSADSARYSYDVVRVGDGALSYAGVDGTRSNEESNQFNARVTYTVDHGDLGGTEIGVSAQFGMIWNGATSEFGEMYAAAGHVVGDYGNFNVQLMGVFYSFDLANPDGQDEDFVAMGAYDAPYKVASEGWLVHANVAYLVELGWGPLDSVTFYNDYSFFGKLVDGYEDTHQNVTGFLLAAGPMFTYVDFAVGKNHPWIGPNYGAALAEGDPDADFELRFNINMGLYF